MTCTGCESEGLYQMSLEGIDGPDVLLYDMLVPDVPQFDDANPQLQKVLESATLPAGVDPWVQSHIPFAATQSFGTQPSSGAASLPGVAGAQELRHGWHFQPSGDTAEGDPSDIYVIPLSLSQTATNGACSGLAPNCATGSQCGSVIVWAFEIWSCIESKKPPQTKPTAKQPQTFSITDPQVATSSVSTSIGSGFGLAGPLINDPRGDALDDAEDYMYCTVQTLELTVQLEADCGDINIWKSKLGDWGVSFAGYSLQTSSSSDLHPSDDREGFAFMVYCKPCKPVVQPGGGGGGGGANNNTGTQGGGKNQNINSIGN